MENMKIEDAYIKLHALATRMKETLDIALHAEDLAPEFKVRVEDGIQSVTDEIQSAIIDFKELNKSLLAPEEPRRLEDENGNYLSVYSPGSGTIGFTWLNSEGKAYGRTVTADEARAALALPKYDNVKGWHLMERHGRVELFPPVRRLAENLLLYKEKVYSYEQKLDSESEDWEKSVAFKLHIGKAPFDLAEECGHEIKHVAVVRALSAFLGAENAYPCPVSLGEKLIDRKTGSEFVVSNISKEQIRGADGDGNEFHARSASLLQAFSSPRLDAEVATLGQTFEAYCAAREGLITQSLTKCPQATPPRRNSP